MSDDFRGAVPGAAKKTEKWAGVDTLVILVADIEGDYRVRLYMLRSVCVCV